MQKIAILIFAILLISCEKDINLNIPNSDPKLVVDGRIEAGQPPIIILTNSLSYYSTLGPQVIAGSFVRNADVFVSNGSVTQKLKEYAMPLAPGFTAYFYSNDTANLPSTFIGQLSTTYNLKIVTASQEYLATTHIPAQNATLDSAWVLPAPNNPDPNKRILMLRITDPPGRGNYVRYFTRRNREDFLPGENSVFDDQIIDGTTFDVQLAPGINRNNPPKADSNFFNKGDTITVKFADIDKATFDFWNTWEFAFQSIGNPFAQPNKVIGNISHAALGVFSGYAPRFKTIIAK